MKDKETKIIKSNTGMGDVPVIIPASVSNMFIERTSNIVKPTDDTMTILPLQRAHAESMLLAVTRVIEAAWRRNTNVKALLLHPMEFDMLMDETANLQGEALKQSIALRLYAGTLHQIFGMKMEPGHPDNESIAILGDRDDFDYEKFKKDNNL